MDKIKEKILVLLNKKALSFQDLTQELNISEDEIPFIRAIISELEISGRIFLGENQEYTIFPNDEDLFVGQLRYDRKKKPFLLSGKNTIYLINEQLNGAVKGDIVLVRKNVFQKMGDNRGIVEKIIKRSNHYLIFECRKVKGKLKLFPVGCPFPINTSFSKSDKEDFIEGSYYGVLLGEENHNGIYHGEVVTHIGNKSDPLINIKLIIASHGIRIDFPKKVLEEAKQLPDHVSEEEVALRVIHGGRDLRDKKFFTIDDKRCMDMDDAICVEKNECGNFIIYASIADVAYYVKEGSEIQKEAYIRGTSYYFPGLTILMLPKELAYGICSLKENEDRMTKTIEVELTPDGDVVNYSIYRSVIRSRKKMAYSEINDLFERQIPNMSYDNFLQELCNLNHLSILLDKIKKDRGYVCFPEREYYTELDQNGELLRKIPRTRGMSENWIENFMLLANEMVGRYPLDKQMAGMAIPYIYRIHANPDKNRMKEVVNYLIQSGFNIKRQDYTDPKNLQELLDRIVKLDACPAISDLIIRGLSKAKYSTENIGHSGLGLEYYSHFTSDGRRYSDLQENYTIEHLLDHDYPFTEEYKLRINEVCKHTSEVEKIADKTEREITAYLDAGYMEKRIGMRFQVMIRRIGKRHIEVETSEHISGIIHVEKLLEGKYVLINKETTLYDPENDKKWRIGDYLDVYVSGADKETRSVEFEIQPEKVKSLGVLHG